MKICRRQGGHPGRELVVGGRHRGQQRSELVRDRRALRRGLLAVTELTRCGGHEDERTDCSGVADGQLLGDEPAERVADHDHWFVFADQPCDGRRVVGPQRHRECCRIRTAGPAVAAMIDVDEVQPRSERVEAAIRLLVDAETPVKDQGVGAGADLLHEQLRTVHPEHRHDPPPTVRDPTPQHAVRHLRAATGGGPEVARGRCRAVTHTGRLRNEGTSADEAHGRRGRRSHRSIAGLMAVATLAVGACSSDDNEAATRATATAAAAVTTPESSVAPTAPAEAAGAVTGGSSQRPADHAAFSRPIARRRIGTHAATSESVSRAADVDDAPTAASERGTSAAQRAGNQPREEVASPRDVRRSESGSGNLGG